MTIKKPLKELLRNRYQLINLQQSNLNDLHKLQKLYRLKHIQHRTVFVVACCLFLLAGGVSWYNMVTPSAHELAMLALEKHKELPMAEVQTNRFKQMESYFYRLNVPVKPIFRSDEYWEWLGARRCQFFNIFGAHFYLRNKDTGIVESVYQLPYVHPLTSLNLRENQPVIKEYGSKVVRMHVLDGMMYVVTASVTR